MKTISIFRLTYTLILIILSGNQLFAQVASTSLFNSQPSYNPAVAALHEQPEFTYAQLDGSGETKTVLNNYGFEYDTGDVEKITSHRKSLIGIFLFDDWGIEAFTDLSHKVEIENQNNSGSSVSTAGNTYTIEKTLWSVLLGTSNSPDFKWGIKIAQEKEVVEKFKIENTDLTIGLGITYQINDIIFLSTGGNMVTSDATEKVSNNWFEYYYGASLGLELNTEMQLRLEANTINSPEDGAEKSGSSAANNHRAMEELHISMEFIYEQFRATYQTVNYTINPLSTRPSETKDTTTTTTMGLGYTFVSSSVFVEALQHNSERIRSDFTTTNSDSLELSVGILF